MDDDDDDDDVEIFDDENENEIESVRKRFRRKPDDVAILEGIKVSEKIVIVFLNVHLFLFSLQAKQKRMKDRFYKNKSLFQLF